MKRITIQSVSIVAIAMMAFSSPALSSKKGDEVWFKGASINAIEENLAIALQAPSPGMQASASQVVRDLKALLPDQDFSGLTIPLMAIVKDEEAEVAVRMVAALALHDLQSAKGDFAIQRVAQFTRNERMRHLCTWLTYDRMQKAPSTQKSTAQLDE